MTITNSQFVRLTALFLVFSLSVSGLRANESVLIQGCIENVPEEIENVRIAYLSGNELRVKAETPIGEDGCFQLNWGHPERGIFILYLDPSHTMDFIISTSAISVTGSYEHMGALEIKGAGMSEFQSFKSLMRKSPDQAQLEEFIYAIEDQHFKEFIVQQLVPENPTDQVYWLRGNFWNNTNLESVSTRISPFFTNNLNTYFEQVLGHDPDTIIFHLGQLFSQPMDTTIKKMMVSQATYHYETSKYMGEDEVFCWLVDVFYKSGYAKWVSKDKLGDIIEKSEGLKTELIGNTAPDFAFNLHGNPDQRMRLSQVEAKVTILYFWDSGCSHCKKETPVLAELYQEYKEKGVEVVAITLENEFDAWNKYIAQHNLEWINGCELDFNRPNFLWYYYIPSTPKKLILDADKKIIAKNLEGDILVRFLNDYLTSLETLDQ